MPVRTAVLKAITQRDPETLVLELRSKELTFSEGTYEWVAHYNFRNKTLLAALASVDPTERYEYLSLDAYYDRHRLGKPTDGSRDEHYAERKFIERAFLPVFGLAALPYLRPQVPFKDTEGRQRYIDFVLEGSVQYAIEVEGRAYHGNIDQEQFEDEKLRQRSLQAAGYRYVPLTALSIFAGRAEQEVRKLVGIDPILSALAEASSQDSQPNRSLLIYLQHLLVLLPSQYRRCQVVALTLLWRALTADIESLTIVENAAATPAFALALLDTVTVVERVAELYGLRVTLPSIKLHLVNPIDEPGINDVLLHYRSASLEQSDNRVDRPHTPVRVVISEAPTEAHYVFHGLSTDVATPDGLFPIDQERLIAPFLAVASGALPGDISPVSTDRSVLDYFARRYFSVPELKREQAVLMQRILNNESSLGILPTGFGKSLIFQLFALLVPRTTLVISPLRALIRDQSFNLERLGLICVDAITVSDSLAEKQAKQQAFREHKYRMLYISPERLRITSFSNDLEATMQDTPVGALVIDEAHCVSEWGHDFRPAYLRVNRLRHQLEEASGRHVPILALTATASEKVRHDIVAVLGLPPNSIVQPSSSDRPNLSLSVHSVAKPHEKPAELARLVRDVIPQVLKIPPEELLHTDEHDSSPHAGVVFGIYANAHGRTTHGEGVHTIGEKLRQLVFHRSDLVQVHASAEPSVCPRCQSPAYIGRSVKRHGRYYCTADGCNNKFDRPVTLPDWENAIIKRQESFQNNEFPMLVATKGFGMGIDKPNIRLIVHHALASGLGAYYQEAGRAGRDGDHAHIALLYLPPNPRCREESIDALQPPRCVSEENNYQAYACPYYHDHLCDFGHQSRLIQGDYAGVEADVTLTLDVYRRVRSAGTFVVTKDEARDSKQELALHRLKELGIITDYSIDYRSFPGATFHVQINPNWTFKDVAKQLQRILVNYNVGAEYAQAQTSLIFSRGSYDDLTSAESENLLAGALRLLLERIYETVPRMRYQMLRDELDYAQSDLEGKCRRIIIRSVFDITDHLISEDYRCEFCDVCVPDLNIVRKEAVIPLQDAHIEDFAQQLPALLDGFDAAALREIVHRATDNAWATSLLTKVTHRLEQDSTNVSALYIAGALERRRSHRDQVSLDYLRFGYKQGSMQGLGHDDLLLFYHEAADISPEDAFSWLLSTDSIWDTEEWLPFLVGEAQQHFGTSSHQYRALKARWQVKAYRALTASATLLYPSLNRLVEGFDTLNMNAEERAKNGAAVG